MEYLVQMRLSSSARPMSPDDGIKFIKEIVLPTLEQCEKLQKDKKILSGGPMIGAFALALIVTAESAQELDDLIMSLPVWSRMETEVTPLTTFDGRRRSALSMPETLGKRAREAEVSRPGGGE
ncbi:MAG TPA: muconolactone Delta-isomerase family protein [Bryobacteraceae bacterium]|nr:muconolactone Delta-isomerase family protein [Bryobacteraceae bacterium]